MKIEEDPGLVLDNKLDAFLEGGAVLLRGMLTIFAVLTIIWFCLYLVRLLIERMTGTASAPEKDVAHPTPAAPAPVTPVTPVGDGELIAVITAAIAAAEAEAGHSGFRVVSFRRVNK